MQSADLGNRVLLVLAILGGGIALGIFSETLWAIGLAAAAIGIILNAYLLAQLALKAGRREKLTVALLGAIPAGLFDAAKIFLIGLMVRWIAR